MLVLGGVQECEVNIIFFYETEKNESKARLFLAGGLLRQLRIYAFYENNYLHYVAKITISSILCGRELRIFYREHALNVFFKLL